MKKFIEKCKKWLLDRSTLDWIFGAKIIIIPLIIIFAFFLTDITNTEKQSQNKLYEYLYYIVYFFSGIVITDIVYGLIIWMRTRMPKELVLGSEEGGLKQMRKGFWSTTIFSLAIVVIALFVINFGDNIIDFLGLSGKFKEEKEYWQFYRNRGFAIAALAGLFVTIIGMGLTIWNRIQTNKQIELTRKSNASERYKEAAHMLGSSDLAVRVGGCYALRDLGIGDKDMALQCAELLMLFTSNPYFNAGELSQIGHLIDEEREKKLEEFFSNDKKLKADIQAASDGFNAICEHYYQKGESLFLRNVNLPSYFWKNEKKGIICLPHSIIQDNNLKGGYLRKANLQQAYLDFAQFQGAMLWGANLQRADLTDAYLQKANLGYANLKKSTLYIAKLNGASLLHANLLDADLSGADLSEADMRSTKNLTKEQILSAKWGYSETDYASYYKPPELPEEFLQDEDIKKWISEPHYRKPKIYGD